MELMSFDSLINILNGGKIKNVLMKLEPRPIRQ